MSMEFLGIDLTKLAGSNSPPLTPEAILKDFPLELLTKPISPYIPAPKLEINGCGDCGSTSWLTEIQELLAEVWRQPLTQFVGVSVAVTGIAVCSWRLSQYWDEDSSECFKAETKPRNRQATKKRTAITSTRRFKSEERSVGVSSKSPEQLNVHVPLCKDLEREGFQNRLGKVMGRVQDIVRDLKQLDCQRETLHAEIRLHQETCSKLQELGHLERSKRQAAEDKVKMIESENLQLKKLNQIIAKKASLIDKLESIIKEKNALEDYGPMTYLAISQQEENTTKSENCNNRSAEILTDANCPMPRLVLLDKPREEQELKATSSHSSCSERGDKSSSVVVLSEDDNEHCQKRSSPSWQNLSPVIKISPFRLRGMVSATSSLTDIARPASRQLKRRSNSLRRSSERNLMSPGKSDRENYVNIEQTIAVNLENKHSLENRAANENNASVDVRGKESFVNRQTEAKSEMNQERITGKVGLKFEITSSPPKSILKSDISTDGSSIRSLGHDSCFNTSSHSLEGRCRDVPESSTGGRVQSGKSDLCNEAMIFDIRNDEENPQVHKGLSSETVCHAVSGCEDIISSREEPVSNGKQLDLVKKSASNEPLNLVERSGSKTEISTEIHLSPTKSTGQEATSLSEKSDTKISEYSHDDTTSLCRFEQQPNGGHTSLCTGITNVFKKNKPCSSKKQELHKKGQFQAVKFINRGNRDGDDGDDDIDGNHAKKRDDTWVVIMEEDE